MPTFTYTWNDGYTTNVDLPTELGWDCAHTSPSSAFNSFSAQILADASHSSDLNEVESYCANAEPVLTAYYNTAVAITNYWDQLEIQCANQNYWFWGYCSNDSAYCNMSENELEDAYYSWQPLGAQVVANLNALLVIWGNATEQLEIDGQQAYSSAIINQMIAQTNNIISLTAYEDESRDLAVQKKKTKDIFVPIMIILIMIGLGVFLFKK